MALDSKSKGGPAKKDPKKAEAAPPVLVYTLLEEAQVVLFPEGTTREEVLAQLNSALCASKGLGDPGPWLSSVIEREKGISTTLDTGLSLPHARTAQAKDFMAALGLVPKGLPDPQQPDITVRAVLLFFSPSDAGFFQRHLQFLRHVATLFQPGLIDQLVDCRTPREVLAALRARET